MKPYRWLVAVPAAVLLLAVLPPSPAQPGEAEAAAPACERTLLAEPGGDSLGCVNAGTPVRVQERIPGWVRIRVEGWIQESEVLHLATPAGKASVAGTAVGPEGNPASGATARLLSPGAELDQALEALRQRHEASRLALNGRLSEIDRALDKALFSSDNLYEANQNRNRLREDKQNVQGQIETLRRASLQEALSLLVQRQVGIATADAAGFFLIEGVEPGKYRLLLLAGQPGEGQAWYLPLSLKPGERLRIDLTSADARQDPFAHLR